VLNHQFLSEQIARNFEDVCTSIEFASKSHTSFIHRLRRLESSVRSPRVSKGTMPSLTVGLLIPRNLRIAFSPHPPNHHYRNRKSYTYDYAPDEFAPDSLCHARAKVTADGGRNCH